MATRARASRDAALRALLVDRGIRVTDQRLVILRELAKLRTPISHPELTERLDGTTLDRATIYRNLLGLAEAGMLVRTQLGDGVWRYELPKSGESRHGTHAHFVCTECGDLECLPEDAVDVKAPLLKVTVAEVQLRGRCADCAR